MTFWDNLTKNLVGLIVVGGFVGIVWFISIFGLKVDTNSAPIAYGLLGSVGTLAGIVVGFWYGSSEGSKRATQALAEQADKNADRAAAVAKDVAATVAAAKPTLELTPDMQAKDVTVKAEGDVTVERK